MYFLSSFSCSCKSRVSAPLPSLPRCIFSADGHLYRSRRRPGVGRSVRTRGGARRGARHPGGLSRSVSGGPGLRGELIPTRKVKRRAWRDCWTTSRVDRRYLFDIRRGDASLLAYNTNVEKPVLLSPTKAASQVICALQVVSGAPYESMATSRSSDISALFRSQNPAATLHLSRDINISRIMAFVYKRRAPRPQYAHAEVEGK